MVQNPSPGGLHAFCLPHRCNSHGLCLAYAATCSHSYPVNAIICGFRAALDLDIHPLSNFIRPLCAERAKPSR